MCLTGAHFHLGYHTWWAYDQETMALSFNNKHIIYYYMDVQQSMGLAWILTIWLFSVGPVLHIFPLTLLTK